MNEKIIDKYLKYFYAASNYYGTIELDTFIDAYFKEKEFDELYELFFLCFENNLIQVYQEEEHYYLTCYENREDVIECLKLQKDKPISIIPKNELLKYANREYYPANELAVFLMNQGMDETEIIDFMNYMMSIYFDFEVAITMLVEIAIVEKVVTLLRETYNDTPLHANRGSSPNEMVKESGKRNRAV